MNKHILHFIYDAPLCRIFIHPPSLHTWWSPERQLQLDAKEKAFVTGENVREVTVLSGIVQLSRDDITQWRHSMMMYRSLSFHHFFDLALTRGGLQRHWLARWLHFKFPKGFPSSSHCITSLFSSSKSSGWSVHPAQDYNPHQPHSR